MPSLDPLAKRWWQSKTVWLNVFTLVTLILPALIDADLVRENPRLVAWLACGLAVGNVVLRWLSTAPLAVWIVAAMVLLPGVASAQSVTLPAEIRGAPGAWVIIAPEAIDGGKPKWRIAEGLQEVRLDLLFPPEVTSLQKGLVLTALQPGRYKVEAWNAKGDVPSEIAVCTVVIGNPPPVPPGPPPNPPVPPPVPPVPAAGFRVLILHEASPQSVLPESQLAIFTSPELRAYLNSKCAKETTGQPAYRVWDDDYSDADLVNAPEYWRTIYPSVQSAAAGKPWIFISTPTEVFSGPLPATVAETLALLKQYGG